MKSILILVAFIPLSCSRLDVKLGNALLSLLQDSFKADDPEKLQALPNYAKEVKDEDRYVNRANYKIKNDNADAEQAKFKAKVVQRARENEENLNDDGGLISQFLTNKQSNKFHMDPVLNVLKRSGVQRRTNDKTDDDASSSSSSREMKDWKTEWNEQWLKKKLEALNASAPQGDVVNMLAARPWGVPCGDPHQHDMPWGTCMLAAECEAEFRIYRGDYLCGRTHFVCCALQLTTYDMYQGFDVSLADSSLETDSSEKRDRNKGSKEKRRKRKAREKRRRKRLRENRKKKIKRQIKKIVREVRKILNKAYRNGSTIRRKKTKTLKKYIKYLKKRYRKDRDTVKDIHEIQLRKIDVELMRRIQEVRALNKNFMTNDTFREIVTSGIMSARGARMLVEAYPELEPFIAAAGETRRFGKSEPPKDYLDYDIEYGLLYS